MTGKRRIVGPDEWRLTLEESFRSIEDPRKKKGKMHRMIDIFIMTVYGLLWGYTDFVNMCKELRYHEQYFTDLLGLKHGIPSHDTFSALFRLINPKEFTDRFMTWMAEIVRTQGTQLAIDGKAIRAACQRVHNGKIPYVLNAACSQLGVVVAQMRIDDKSNEIAAIPQMLEILDLEDTTVTIDAIGTHVEIAKLIDSKGGYYVLPVKENQKKLQEVIDAWFCEHADKEPAYSDTEKDHGRVDTREYWCSTDLSCLDALEKPKRKQWDSIKAIGLVKRTRRILKEEIKEDGSSNTYWIESTERCAYIMNREMEAKALSDAIRGHWKLTENSLHYVLDTVYREDWCTARKGYAMENLALMRKIVFNFTKFIPELEKETTKGKQIYLMHHPEVIENLIFSAIPSLY